MGTASDICLAEAANVEAVSDTCPVSRLVSLRLTDTSTVADGKVTGLSATQAELSDTAPARGVEVPARCAGLSGLSVTGDRGSDRFWTLGGVQSR